MESYTSQFYTERAKYEVLDAERSARQSLTSMRTYIHTYIHILITRPTLTYSNTSIYSQKNK